MRVLLISPMPPILGGVSVSTQRLYDNLKQDGFDVHYYNIHPASKFLGSKMGLTLVFFWIPFYILFHKKYDIIHCHVPSTYRKLYLSLSKPLFFKSAKLIFTLHGDVRPLLNRLSIYALSKADKIICVQKGDSEKLPSNLAKKSVDIPAFILPKEISEKDIPDYVLDFAKNKDKPLILFYGSIVFSEHFKDLYGIKDSIDMFEELAKENVEAKMLMLVSYKIDCNIDFLKYCRERVKDNKNIMFVENEKMPMLPLFKYSNLYIRPTKTDGDSLAVREALSMNCTVIASDKAKRPEGTIIYSTTKDFFNAVKINITVAKVNYKQQNFYEEIKKTYEFI